MNDATEEGAGVKGAGHGDVRFLVHEGAGAELLRAVAPWLPLVTVPSEDGGSVIFSADEVLDARFHPFRWFGNVPFGLFAGGSAGTGAGARGTRGGGVVAMVGAHIAAAAFETAAVSRLAAKRAAPPLVLFMSRGKAGSAKRALANERAVLAALRGGAAAMGVEVCQSCSMFPACSDALLPAPTHAPPPS